MTSYLWRGIRCGLWLLGSFPEHAPTESSVVKLTPTQLLLIGVSVAALSVYAVKNRYDVRVIKAYGGIDIYAIRYDTWTGNPASLGG
jgi:hypothetical protein